MTIECSYCGTELNSENRRIYDGPFGEVCSCIDCAEELISEGREYEDDYFDRCP